ncbi:hypothetical protein O9K51_02466 [Purpureocillium lavendulum]|uniref:Suppressor of anucleate metulae protein B n=1 Tax=Purpureocillium lavendulum TaxID=1247861 RepID=A0AB34FXD9_9HYPO|nr:hypothetical protein O9K51_02466 [Purpureocillium lavendulum]
MIERNGTYANQFRANLGDGLVLGDGDVCEERAVADDGRVRVALDVGPPLPARGVWVAGSEELGLQALELLLVSKLVGLNAVSGEVTGASVLADLGSQYPQRALPSLQALSFSAHKAHATLKETYLYDNAETVHKTDQQHHRDEPACGSLLKSQRTLLSSHSCSHISNFANGGVSGRLNSATMASPSVHAMPEHWTELSAAKRQRQLCAHDVEAIKTSCASECGKKHVAECSGCYGKILDRMRQRYTGSTDREWFTQRRAFLQELEGMFQDARDHVKSLNPIEARIESEKEAWYRWVLRKYPEFIAASDRGANQDELRAMLDDPDRLRDELIKMVLEGVGKPPNWPSSVETFADKADAAKDDPAELKRLYIAEFFTSQASGSVLDNAQKYLEDFQGSDSLTVEDIVDRMVSDIKESRNSQPQRENHQRRLDELRRAKKAFEQNKMQAKSQLSGNNASGASEVLHNLPPCLVCKGAVDSSKVLSCSVCQAIAQMGGASKMAVYCSEECFHKGHGDHVAAEHDCEAGDKCVQLRDEDVEMDDGSSLTVSCKECLDERRMTLYCSDRCAAENVAEHRQRVHGVKTAAGEGEARALVTPTQGAVEAALQRENPGLQMTPV